MAAHIPQQIISLVLFVMVMKTPKRLFSLAINPLHASPHYRRSYSADSFLLKDSCSLDGHHLSIKYQRFICLIKTRRKTVMKQRSL